MHYKHSLLLTAILLVLSACSSVKNSTSTNDELTDVKIEILEEMGAIEYHNVEVQVMQHFPYCGGAAPTEEMMNQYSPASGNYILVNKVDSSKTTVIADSTGTIYLFLENGEYAIRQMFKDMSFEAFYAKNNDNGNSFTSRGIDCYRKWWEKNLLDFTVNDTTEVKTKITFGSACFTGNNPCLIYNGPYPP